MGEPSFQDGFVSDRAAYWSTLLVIGEMRVDEDQ